MRVTPLQTLQALAAASDLSDDLAAFVAHRLSEASVWSSARVSDGVTTYRVVERGPARLRLCGQIWEISQMQHSFWVNIEWDHGTQSGANWTLFFDIDDTAIGAGRARNAIDVMQDPGEVQWRIRLTGRAE